MVGHHHKNKKEENTYCFQSIFSDNIGKSVRVFATFPSNTQWNAKEFLGSINAVSDSSVVLSNSKTGNKDLIPYKNIDYLTFTEGFEPGQDFTTTSEDQSNQNSKNENNENLNSKNEDNENENNENQNNKNEDNENENNEYQISENGNNENQNSKNEDNENENNEIDKNGDEQQISWEDLKKKKKHDRNDIEYNKKLVERILNKSAVPRNPNS
ncbi:spore coat protein GerQ [Bacillus salipaludis]|uniref:spore coat protein GerQ n=1 Tax=Bacillus salipaludis TaxID=2547811 RepID=UPI002E1A34F5|nr:spore coat protein GerQ [Bacillus salipaludis]